MTASIAYLPNLGEACDRINARVRAENIAKERAKTIKRAKQIIGMPGLCTDEHLREVCAAFMAMSPTPEELADHWLLYYLRADAHISAINDRERKRAHEADRRANETPMQVAKRFAPRWREIAGWGAVGAAVMLAGTGWL